MAESRRHIFKSELQKLKDHRYISEKGYAHLLSLYDDFYARQSQPQDATDQEHAAARQQESSAVVHPAPRQAQPPQHAKASIPSAAAPQNMDNHTQRQQPKQKTPRRSPQQIRDRNITITLVLGVILLLTGGLIVGTSTWDVLHAPMKVLAIGLVSLLFYSISFLSGKWLNIRKTSFAFLTLANLFIPIVFISAGFFQLFGTWLSLSGEGKYLFWALISLLCLPLYAWTALKFQSRLFTWLSLITSTVVVGCFFSPDHFTRDLFFCALIAYNAMLLGLYHRYKQSEKFRLLWKELPPFAQTNLILSSLLMVFIYDQAIFHSFNLFITAILYMAMMFVYRTKEYHFVFSALLAYSFYQLVENTFLHMFDVILIAAFATLFLSLQRYFRDDPYLHKVFQYTAALASFVGFFYTAYQSLVHFSEGSWLIFIAYTIIALHYTYLAHLTQKPLMSYLASVFLVVAGYESWRLLPFIVDFGEIYLFAVATLLFFGLYYKTLHPYLTAIKHSSFVIAVIVMLLTVVAALIQLKWLTASFLLAMFGSLALLLYRTHQDRTVGVGSGLVSPVSWMLGFVFLYQPLSELNPAYGIEFGVPFHICLSALILAGVSRTAMIIRDQRLSTTFFYVSQLGYSLGLLLLFTPLSINASLVVPTLFAIGAFMYTWLAVKTKWNPVWLLVSLTSLFFYLSLIRTFDLTTAQSLIIYLFAVFLLLHLTQRFLSRWGKGSKPYFEGTAHLYLGVVQGIGFILFLLTDIHPLTFVMPFAFYMYHTLFAGREWVKRTFLTLALTYVPVLITCLIAYYHPVWFRYVHVPLVSTIVFALIWAFGRSYRPRIYDYLLPFSLLGMFSLPFYLPSNWMSVDLGLGLLYAVGMLVFLHRRRLSVFNILPLIMLMMFLSRLHYFGIDARGYIFVYLLCFAVLTGVGKQLHSRIWERGVTITATKIDWYSIFALYSLLTVYTCISRSSPLWLQVLPGLLIPLFLHLQLPRTRVDFKVMKTMFWLSLLIPYYTVLINLNISPFIVYEVYLLPAILWTIFLSKYTWKDYGQTMHRLQWGVLVIVAIIIVTNAIQSHTPEEAVKIGLLALVSILGGLHYRIKSYFLVGVTIILLNLFVQSLPMWGLIPWWVYLLLSGSLLIAVASVYEWQKQMKEKKITPIWQVKWQKLRQKFDHWK